MTNKNSIVLNVEAKATYIDQIEVLDLSKIYQRHNDIAFNIIKKNYVLNKTYRQNLYHEFKDIFSSEEEVEQLVFGSSMNTAEFGLRPLSKMTADIRKELEKDCGEIYEIFNDGEWT